MALDADELAEYCKYPETYFGAVMKQGTKSESYVDFCDFLFASYQTTPRERLLELLAKAPDFEKLKELSQRDLAIAYSDCMAATIFKDRPTDPRHAAYEKKLRAAKREAAEGDGQEDRGQKG